MNNFRLIAILIFSIAVLPVRAQNSPSPETQNRIAVEQMERESGTELCDESPTETTARIDYNVWVHAHTINLYEWQLVLGIMVAISAHVVLLTGLTLAIWQFYLAARGKTRQKIRDSSINVTLQGIQVRSSILGILVLIISLLFFYLVLNFAFRVNPPPDAQSTVNALHSKSLPSSD